MKYIVFKNSDRIIDSIITIVPKSIKTEATEDSFESGFGNYRKHKSGGLVFDNLELLKQWFGAMQYFSYQPISNDELSYFIKTELKAINIKWHMRSHQAYNLDLYQVDWDYSYKHHTYKMFREFCKIENYGKIWLDVTGGFFNKKRGSK